MHESIVLRIYYTIYLFYGISLKCVFDGWYAVAGEVGVTLGISGLIFPSCR